MSRLSIFFICTFCILAGCVYYEDVYLVAEKSYFYDSSNVFFQNTDNDEGIILQAEPYECGEGPYREVYSSTRHYKRFHPEYCGQNIFWSSSAFHPLDHVITSEIIFFERKSHIRFENDVFIIDPLPADTNAFYISDTIQNVVYDSLYVLLPSYSTSNSIIGQIHYHASLGMMKVLTTAGQSWVRIQ